MRSASAARRVPRLLAPALLAVPPAHAGFQAAFSEYNAGHYEAAHAQFLTLAELGDCSSQFNLGAMALKGQGGPKDPGSAAGWLQAAAGNGCEPLVGNSLARLQPGLSADEARSAAGIVARYGRDALRAQGIVHPDFDCREVDAASVLQAPTPELPRPGAGQPRSALVITQLTIGVDGLARDPEILLAVGESGFAAAAVESWLNSRFTPAQRAGRPLESQLPAKLAFAAPGATLADTPALAKARPAADAGDAAAAYLVGLAATFDASLGLSAARAGELLITAARDGDPAAQYWIGRQLRAKAGCHSRADGSVWLQHAAAGGSGAAQLLLASDLLGGAPSAAQVQRAGALLQQAAASDSYYVSKHVAALLVASPIDALRDPVTAMSLARRLLAGEIRSDPQMFETVAAVYAANGDFRGAVTQQQSAIRQAHNLGWNTRAMDGRLAAYRGGRTWQGDLFALPPAGVP